VRIRSDPESSRPSPVRCRIRCRGDTWAARVLAAAGAGLAGAFCIVQIPNHQQAKSDGGREDSRTHHVLPSGAPVLATYITQRNRLRNSHFFRKKFVLAMRLQMTPVELRRLDPARNMYRFYLFAIEPRLSAVAPMGAHRRSNQDRTCRRGLAAPSGTQSGGAGMVTPSRCGVAGSMMPRVTFKDLKRSLLADDFARRQRAIQTVFRRASAASWQ
jgi:hypothetical protein